MKRKITMILALALVLSMAAFTACGADKATAQADQKSTVDTILSAGTTQAFKDEPVPEADVSTILRAGLSATSAMNAQPWFFAAVSDKALLREIDSPEEGGSAGPNAGMGDSPLAIIIYKDDHSASFNADLDCGLAVQNMYIAAVSLGYGAKLVSSPTLSLNGADHDAICAKLGVDPSLTAVTVLLVGKPDMTVDGVTGASPREGLGEKTSIIG